MNPFDPAAIFATLNRHDVEYVVIGGIANALHGGHPGTYLLQICAGSDSQNLTRLATALREMEARPRGEAIDPGFRVQDDNLRGTAIFRTATSYGDVDFVANPAGSGGFESLFRNSRLVELESNQTLRVCSVEDLTAMQHAAAFGENAPNS